MTWHGSDENGFLLMEVLIAMLILAVVFTVYLGAMAQCLRVSTKSSQLTDALSEFEPLLFEVESGLKPELAGYGGRSNLKGGYWYQVDVQKSDLLTSWFKSRLSWKGEREFLELQMVALRSGAQ